MIIERIHKGEARICKVYKGDVLLWDECIAPPTNLNLTILDDGADVPIAPTGLVLTEVESATIVAPPTGLTLTEVETVDLPVEPPTGLTLTEVFVAEAPVSPTGLVLTIVEEADTAPPVAPTGLVLTEGLLGLAPPTGLVLTEVSSSPPIVGTIVVNSYGIDYVVISCPFAISEYSTLDFWYLFVNGELVGGFADDPISLKTISGLSAGENVLEIRVYDSEGLWGQSPPTTQLLGAPYAPTGLTLTELDDTVVITPPTNLIATGETETSINIQWTHGSPIGDYYEIQHQTGIAKWQKITQLNQSSIATITGLVPDTEYNIRVFSRFNDGSASDYSNVLVHSTDVDIVASNPTRPLLFDTITPWSNYIYGVWSGATGDIAGYNLYIRTSDDQPFTFVKFIADELNGNGQGHFDSFNGYPDYLIQGSVYTIQVETVGKDGTVSPTRLESSRVYTLFSQIEDLNPSYNNHPTRYISNTNFTLEYNNQSIGTHTWYKSGAVYQVGGQFCLYDINRTTTIKLIETNGILSFEKEFTVTVLSGG